MNFLGIFHPITTPEPLGRRRRDAEMATRTATRSVAVHRQRRGQGPREDGGDVKYGYCSSQAPNQFPIHVIFHLSSLSLIYLFLLCYDELM